MTLHFADIVLLCIWWNVIGTIGLFIALARQE